MQNFIPRIKSSWEEAIPSKLLLFLSFQIVHMQAKKERRHIIFPLEVVIRLAHWWNRSGRTATWPHYNWTPPGSLPKGLSFACNGAKDDQPIPRPLSRGGKRVESLGCRWWYPWRLEVSILNVGRVIGLPMLMTLEAKHPWWTCSVNK